MLPTGLDYSALVSGYIEQMMRIGYSQQAIEQIVSHYSGYPNWQDLSAHQQKRLASDLKRHIHIARKWQYSLTGQIR